MSSAALPARGPLRRRTESRLVAGVAGGIADWLNAPITAVRLAIVVALTWEPTLWVYAAAAVVLPPRGRSRPGWDNLVAVGRLALLVAVPWILFPDGQDLSFVHPTIAVPAQGLLLVGALAFFSADYIRERPRTNGESRGVVLAALPVALPLTAAAAAMVAIPDVRWDSYLPLVPVVGGSALVLAAFAGRPRPFVAPAVLAVAIAAAVSTADARLEGGVGDLRVAPRDSAVIRRASGDVVVDLRQVPPGRDVRVEATVGRGHLLVGVPGRAGVELTAHVGQGRVDAGLVNRSFHEVDGFDRSVNHRYRATSSRGPIIHLLLRVGTGSIEVRDRENFTGHAARL